MVFFFHPSIYAYPREKKGCRGETKQKKKIKERGETKGQYPKYTPSLSPPSHVHNHELVPISSQRLALILKD